MSNYTHCGSDCPGYDDKVVGFNAFRDKPASPNYAAHPTAVTYDVTLAGLIFAAVILFVSFLIILPGIRGIQRLWAFIRVTVSLFIGLTILLCLYGVDWEYGVVYVEHLPYKAFTRHEINATVGLHIGLKEINITLKGDPILQLFEEENQNESISYNEQYTFCCGQGRTGFGPYAGRINREFRGAQWRGTPLPILWVLEYFTLDGENIRWGRAYRLSGWYTNIMLWTAFPLWLLSNILMFMVIRYGAYFLSLTGGCMLTGNIIFATLRNTLGAEKDFEWIPLAIPLNESTLVLEYGWCFWMNMSVGLICVVLAFVIYIMDVLYPLGTASFFNVDPLQDFEEHYIPVGSVDDERPVSFIAGKSDGSVQPSVDLGYDDQFVYENVGQEKLVFRTKGKSLFAKNRSSKGPLSRPRDSLGRTANYEEFLKEGAYMELDTTKLTEE